MNRGFISRTACPSFLSSVPNSANYDRPPVRPGTASAAAKRAATEPAAIACAKRPTLGVYPVQAKHVLCEINPQYRHLHIRTLPFLRLRMVEATILRAYATPFRKTGRVHSIRRLMPRSVSHQESSN